MLLRLERLGCFAERPMVAAVDAAAAAAAAAAAPAAAAAVVDAIDFG